MKLSPQVESAMIYDNAKLFVLIAPRTVKLLPLVCCWNTRGSILDYQVARAQSHLKVEVSSTKIISLP